MIYYSGEFKKKVRTLYPNGNVIKQMLENNDERLGEKLRIGYLEPLTFEGVRKAKSMQELEELIDEKQLEEKFQLYKEWCDIYVKQNFWKESYE